MWMSAAVQVWFSLSQRSRCCIVCRSLHEQNGLSPVMHQEDKKNRRNLLVTKNELEGKVTCARLKQQGQDKMANFAVPSTISCVEKLLFGGAMVCKIPENSLDASAIREVPDHQEVFCHKTTDQSIIIDILEYQEQSQREEAVRCHFFDIADANDAAGDNCIQLIEPLSKEEISMSQCNEAWYLSGIQKVAKFNEETAAKNIVEIQLGLFRLPLFRTDIVISMNNPMQVSKESSSSQIEQCSANSIWTTDVFKMLLSSLNILDTSLFC